jgi:hypothetical protein
MASELEIEIQQHLCEYLDGKLQQHELEDWLIPTLWDLAESHDDGARGLAGRIENLISENSRGDRSNESLQEELTRIGRPFVLRQLNPRFESSVASQKPLLVYLWVMGSGSIRKAPQMATNSRIDPTRQLVMAS